MDYRVRGFTRDISGRKHYIDHEINSIQNYLAEDTRSEYKMIDVNIYQENIFHTKMMLKDLVLDRYLFGISESDLSEDQAEEIYSSLYFEMEEIFTGRNIDRPEE